MLRVKAQAQNGCWHDPSAALSMPTAWMNGHSM
jgi:hypothetical protein